MQTHSKPEDPILQNAAPCRKSAPCPLNMSDGCLAGTAIATRHASLQALRRPTPAITFEHATKRSRVAHVWQSLESIAPGILTSRSGARPSGFHAFDLRRCFAPERHALFLHLNFQKRAGGSALRCFSHFILDFEICFAPNSRVHFLNIESSKSVPRLRYVAISTLKPVLAACRSCVRFFRVSTAELAPDVMCF